MFQDPKPQPCNVKQSAPIHLQELDLLACGKEGGREIFHILALTKLLDALVVKISVLMATRTCTWRLVVVVRRVQF